jgi:hypothetical protein
MRTCRNGTILPNLKIALYLIHNPKVLRKVFSVIILLLAIQMIVNGITGRI